MKTTVVQEEEKVEEKEEIVGEMPNKTFVRNKSDWTMDMPKI